jgi:hypothetical protein
VKHARRWSSNDEATACFVPGIEPCILCPKNTQVTICWPGISLSMFISPMMLRHHSRRMIDVFSSAQKKKKHMDIYQNECIISP